MKHQVPAEILKKTTQCLHNFSCLETGNCGESERCAHEYVDGDCVIFLHDRQYKACRYRLAFGDSQICCCPTHHAILKGTTG